MDIKIMLLYVVILVLLFGPMLYSNSKKKKKFEAMIAGLEIGTKIVTIGGIYGSITKIDDTTVDIKVDKGVSIKIGKDAIARVEG